MDTDAMFLEDSAVDRDEMLTNADRLLTEFADDYAEMAK